MKLNAKTGLIAALLLLLLTGCEQKDPRPGFMPDDERMVCLFCDIHITESMKRLGYIKSNEYAKPYYRNILREYGLTEQEFDSCLAYLSRNHDEYEKIYENVLQRLRAMRDHEDSAKEDHAARERSPWKDFGTKLPDLSAGGDLWLQLDSINCVLPPEFRKKDSRGCPYIE